MACATLSNMTTPPTTSALDQLKHAEQGWITDPFRDLNMQSFNAYLMVLCEATKTELTTALDMLARLYDEAFVPESAITATGLNNLVAITIKRGPWRHLMQSREQRYPFLTAMMLSLHQMSNNPPSNFFSRYDAEMCNLFAEMLSTWTTEQVTIAYVNNRADLCTPARHLFGAAWLALYGRDLDSPAGIKDVILTSQPPLVCIGVNDTRPVFCPLPPDLTHS